ncbi:MAG: hypothetical protein KIT73_05005, partial [Burkholderiales bacterium]|nr:hypothetical protein [Burkholderiales bacterium]
NGGGSEGSLTTFAPKLGALALGATDGRNARPAGVDPDEARGEAGTGGSGTVTGDSGTDGAGTLGNNPDAIDGPDNTVVNPR